MSMTEILPGLWVGNLKARGDTEALVARGFGCVINCCSRSILSRYNIRGLPDSIEQIHLSIKERGPDDKESIDSMINALPIALDRIEAYLNIGKPVLVHCYAGKHRSPTIIIAYLMRKCRLSLAAATDIVRTLWTWTGSDYTVALMISESIDDFAV